MDDLVKRAYQAALPDPQDEREVMCGPLLKELADAIERLSVGKAALESDKRVAEVGDAFYKLTVTERDAERAINAQLRTRIAALEAENKEQDEGCKDLQEIILRLNARVIALEAELAAIKAGQPVEVAGEQMQLVPVEPSNKMIDVGLFANKTTPTGQLYSAIPAYRAMLTASAAERKV